MFRGWMGVVHPRFRVFILHHEGIMSAPDSFNDVTDSNELRFWPFLNNPVPGLRAIMLPAFQGLFVNN